MSAKRKPSAMRAWPTGRGQTRRGQQFITEVVTLTSTVQVSKEDVQALDENMNSYPDESFIETLCAKYRDLDEEFECSKCETYNDPDANFCKKCGHKRSDEHKTFDVTAFNWGPPSLDISSTTAFEEAMKTLCNFPSFTGEGTGFITFYVAAEDTTYDNIPLERRFVAFVIRPKYFEWRTLDLTIN